MNKDGGLEGQPEAQQGCTNKAFMACHTRTASCNAAVFGEPGLMANYEVVVNSDGDFAARRLDTGYIVAGYDHRQPLLEIDEAAQSVFAQADITRVYVHGDFSMVMCRIINEYYDGLRAKHTLMSYRFANFPMGRIRPDALID